MNLNHPTINMKKLLLAVCTVTVAHATVLAQTEAPKDTTKNWKFGGFTSLQVNQVALMNWAAGGENSVSGTVLLGGFANYQKGVWSWSNSVDLGYGLIYTDRFGLQKNEDKIDVLTKVNRAFKDKSRWSMAALVNFKSQFAPGYKLPDDSTVISRFMAPGYLIVSLGVEYKPWDWVTFYLSPATGKFTFVMDQTLADQGAFGVDAAVKDAAGDIVTPGKNINPEFGAMFNMTLKKDIMKNITLATVLNLFNNYTDKDRENAKNIDVNWETTINMKVNKYITVSLFTHLIYDHDIKIGEFDKDGNPVYMTRADGTQFLDEKGAPIQKKGPKLQFKEVLGVGFSYKF